MEEKKYYSKKELARAYAPDLCYDSAKKRLQRWITHDPVLVRKLKKTGYNPRQRQLTKWQTSLIIMHLG